MISYLSKMQILSFLTIMPIIQQFINLIGVLVNYLYNDTTANEFSYTTSRHPWHLT